MTEKEKKVDFLDKTAEIYAWFEVVVASLIVGLIVGSATYYSNPNPTRLYIAIASVLLSLIIGGFLGNKNRNEKQKIHQDTTSAQSSGAFEENDGHTISKQRTT